MSYLCDLYFIFSLIFIVINNVTLLKQTHLFFVHFLEYLLLFLDDNADFSLALLMKVFQKKACSQEKKMSF